MAWFTGVVSVVSGLADIVKVPLQGWQDRKTEKSASDNLIAQKEVDVKIAVADAKIERAKAGQLTEADWDSKAQDDMKSSWKDEFLMILLFFPVLMLFGSAFFENPAFQARIIAAVKALEEFPMWYVVMLLGIVAAVYGLRWLIGPLVNKMTAAKKKI